MKKHGEIAKAILLGVGITSAIVIVAAAPGVVLAAKMFEMDKKRFPKKYERQKTARAMERLQKSQFIRIKEKNGKYAIELTKKGKQKFKDLQLENLKLTKPLKWDGKWRIVVFDIPEKSFRYGREALRSKLKQWEFYQLQKSVWVCPWPCEKEIEFITELYEVTPFINLIVAEKIGNEATLRKYFNL